MNDIKEIISLLFKYCTESFTCCWGNPSEKHVKYNSVMDGKQGSYISICTDMWISVINSMEQNRFKKLIVMQLVKTLCVLWTQRLNMFTRFTPLDPPEPVESILNLHTLFNINFNIILSSIPRPQRIMFHAYTYKWARPIGWTWRETSASAFIPTSTCNSSASVYGTVFIKSTLRTNSYGLLVLKSILGTPKRTAT